MWHLISDQLQILWLVITFACGTPFTEGHDRPGFPDQPGESIPIVCAYSIDGNNGNITKFRFAGTLEMLHDSADLDDALYDTPTRPWRDTSSNEARLITPLSSYQA